MKTPQFAHQKIGTDALVRSPAFALFDEMGAGKSKQVIDAACILAEQGKIDTVVIVAPASVRCVWLDFEIGEIRKHSWWPSTVWEFHGTTKRIWENGTTGLTWVVTNYEILRSAKHLETLSEAVKLGKVLLVLDESSYIKNRTSQQTKAVAKLRKHCARCVLLNGTPLSNSPMDLWSQFNVLNGLFEKRYKNFQMFRFRYTAWGGEKYVQQRGAPPGTLKRVHAPVGWRNLDKLSKICAPYVLRRLKSDCLDLPEKLYTVREIALTVESWKRYQELKKDCLIHLPNNDSRLEPNAAVRLMRLAQLTSGIYGTTLVEPSGMNTTGDEADFDVSDEKLRWAVQYLTEECTAKAVIVWTRWRRERERLFEILLSKKIRVFQIHGGQDKKGREFAVAAFSSTAYKEDINILIAQPHAGGHGLNLVAASEAIYLSNDFSLGIRLQSEDRCHRPGQVNRVLYTDVLATGPKGQKTIDHIIFKALRDKKNVADLTCAEWRKELEEE